MIAVIFEVWPASGRKEDYLAIAATLRAELEQIDGFISVERFQSLTDAGKLLSLSFWRDEEAVTAWRNQAQHRESQAKGRGGRVRRLPAADRLRRARLRHDRARAGPRRLARRAQGVGVSGYSLAKLPSATILP